MVKCKDHSKIFIKNDFADLFQEIIFYFLRRFCIASFFDLSSDSDGKVSWTTGSSVLLVATSSIWGFFLFGVSFSSPFKSEVEVAVVVVVVVVVQ